MNLVGLKFLNGLKLTTLNYGQEFMIRKQADKAVHN